MTTKVIYKVNDEFVEFYQDALAKADGNEYIVKTIYVELGDSTLAYNNKEFTFEDLVQRHLNSESSKN